MNRWKYMPGHGLLVTCNEDGAVSLNARVVASLREASDEAIALIETAPELLQLVKEWVSEAEDGSLSNGDRRLIRDDTISRTHAAIAKAEGKS